MIESKIKCELCGKEYNSMKILATHLSKQHNMNVVARQEYYDKYFLKDGDCKCFFCDNKAKFKNFELGYARLCDSKVCLHKTYATGTVEGIMYSQNVSYDDAVKICDERAKDRGDKIKSANEKILEANPNFHKERSRNSVEYWKKRGYTEEEANEKAYGVMKNIHKKNSEYHILYPEKYLDVYETQIPYWIKKGYTYDEAVEKRRERQCTFTLDKCIHQYGEVEGINIFVTRHKRWSEKMEKMYQNGEYSKAPYKLNVPPSKLEFEIANGILSKKNIDMAFGYDQYRDFFKAENKVIFYDIKYENKVIEIYGDYWHANPKIYAPDWFNYCRSNTALQMWQQDEYRTNLIKSRGYDLLIVWESDYNADKEGTIQKCIDFLTNKTTVS